jgi:hypothetical protein
MTSDDRIKMLEEKIENSMETIKILNDRIDRQADIIDRLIGGLYHPDEQRNYRRMLYEILDGTADSVSMKCPDTSKWQQDTTTNQGYALEKMVEELNDRIELFETIVDHTADNVANVQSVVYTLIGGLFNIDTQKSTLGTLVARLFGKFNASESTDTSVWEDRPTTIQGDQAEKRIEALERKVFG